MLPPTNESEAIDLILAMDGFYRNAFASFKQNEELYDGQFGHLIALPEGFDVTVPSTSRAIIDEAVDNVVPDDIQVHYAPRGNTKKAEEDADAVRQYLHSWFHHLRRKGSDIDVIRDAAKNGFINGMFIWKSLTDYTLWPVLPKDEEEKLKGEGKLKERVALIKAVRERNVPWSVRSISPRCFFVDPTVSSRKLWAMETYEAGTEEVQNRYVNWVDDFRDYRRSTKHKIYELWTATHVDWKGELKKGRVMIFVDEECVYDEESPYDDLPYIVKYSGLGRETYAGTPESKAVGMYTPQVISLLLAQARRYSQFDAIMQQSAYPIGVLPMSVDPDSFDTSPGAMNFVPDVVFQSTDKIWLQAKIPDGAYMSSLRLLGDQIERGTTQAALRGAPVTGTDSAAQLGMSTGQAKLRLESMRQALQDGLAELCQKVLIRIDTELKDKTSVFGGERATERYTIGPENIRGRYEVSVSFVPNEEAVKERKLALANDAIVKGGMSPYDALVFAGFDNPSEMIARRLAYDVMQEPLVKRAMGKQLLETWGVNADELALQEQMDAGSMQVLLREFMTMVESGSMRGVGDPMTPDGSPPGGGAQDPMAALAQAGQGPMPMPVGAPPQDPSLMPPQAMQQPVMQ